jgi:hypothetical protein
MCPLSLPTWLRPAVAAAFLLVLAGCQVLGIGPRPWFVLPPPPTEAAEAAPVPVQVVDARPWTERWPHEGPFTLATPTQLSPSPLAHLVTEIQGQCRKLPEPPARARVVLRRFCLAINEERRKEHGWQWLPWPGPLSESPSGLHGTNPLELVFVLAAVPTFYVTANTTCWGVDHLWHAGEYRPWRLAHLDYPEWVTCDIAAAVTLTWADGRRETYETHAMSSSGDLPAKPNADALQAEVVPLVVLNAVVQLGADLARQAQPAPAAGGDTAADVRSLIEAAHRNEK